MNEFNVLDTDKAALRVLALIDFHRNRDHPKMKLRELAGFVGIKRHQFDRSYSLLCDIALVEEIPVKTQGKPGRVKKTSLTSLGMQAAEIVVQLYRLLQPEISRPTIKIRV